MDCFGFVPKPRNDEEGDSALDSAEASLSVIARIDASQVVAIYFIAGFYGIVGIYLRILRFCKYFRNMDCFVSPADFLAMTERGEASL